MNSTHSWWPISKQGALTARSSSTSTQSLTRRVSASLVSLTYCQRRYPGRKLLPGAGISVGQYSAAMRTLPAQFTDIATQLAGGQSPFLILLQQGGQIKDQFGGVRAR
jgi:hypothetical protein